MVVGDKVCLCVVLTSSLFSCEKESMSSSGRIVFKQIRRVQRKPLPAFPVVEVPSAQNNQYINVAHWQCRVLNPSVSKRYTIEISPGWPLLELQEGKKRNPSKSVWAVRIPRVSLLSSVSYNSFLPCRPSWGKVALLSSGPRTLLPTHTPLLNAPWRFYASLPSESQGKGFPSILYQ